VSRDTPERGGPRRFGDVLGQLLRAKKFYQKGKYGALVDAWREVVGEEIGARTRIVSFEHGRITVEVTDAALHQELSGFMRAALVQQLQQAAGGEDVVELRFRLGAEP